MNSFSSGDLSPDILYEDRDILVCRKPAGLPVQTSRIGTRDLVSVLKNHLSAVTHRPPYLAVIHRLDQPVEGLLVFAKTPAAARALNRQLTGAGFGKYYQALVCGHPSPEEGTLTSCMVKDARTNTSRICTKDTPGAKEARLSYRTLKSLGAISLLEIHLDTGRHHQIRVQLASCLGCPIVGDVKYGGTTGPFPENSPLKLCAYRLDFSHPVSGKAMHFELPGFSGM